MVGLSPASQSSVRGSTQATVNQGAMPHLRFSLAIDLLETTAKSGEAAE
jgi:hypothetical protein